MNKLKVYLENCYGIKKLETEFNFEQNKTYIIYAPNGSMKTSFAKTLDSVVVNAVFKTRKIKREITYIEKEGDLYLPLPQNEIFVIKSYDEVKIGNNVDNTLMLDEKLQEKYKNATDEIKIKKEILIKKLSAVSGLKENILEETFKTDFKTKDFGRKIIDFKIEINQLQKGIVIKDFNHTNFKYKYKDLRNPQLNKVLEDTNFINNLKSYLEQYNTLISKSKILKKGFDHNNVNNIIENLAKNGFTKVDQDSLKICTFLKNEWIPQTEEELKKMIKDDIDKITTDPKLKASFNLMTDKYSQVNEGVKNFLEILQNDPYIIDSCLNNIEFLKDIWLSYLIKYPTETTELIKLYEDNQSTIDEIILAIQDPSFQTQWHNVVADFKKCFTSPFEITIENIVDVILGDSAKQFKFTFIDEDNGETENIAEDILRKDILSQGEKRALYLLHIIFNIYTRKEKKERTIFIIDDIADSFDYQNKYAIIEYLQEISEVDKFYQIILTHNYDFFRTISSRLKGNGSNKLQAIRLQDEVILKEVKYKKNPFAHWRKNLDIDVMLIASIPFIRNLTEYCNGKNCNPRDTCYNIKYHKLTSLLHIKKDTYNITNRDLQEYYTDILPFYLIKKIKNLDNLVIDDIRICANNIEKDVIAGEELELESKIVLSVAIRLEAEKFMIKEINDQAVIDAILKNQTIELFKLYKLLPTKDINKEKILKRVNLMTPENIHLNSFMYEPIIDMSAKKLMELYIHVKNL